MKTVLPSRSVDERQLLKENIVSVFDKAAPLYERVGPGITSHFNKQLVERCGIFSGADVLDVATGRGGVLFPAAEKTGPSGSIIGIDLSQQMLKESRQEAIRQNLQHVGLYEMDAERLDIPENTFDFVTCGFAVPIFPRSFTALREMKRVLKPGGVLGFNTWTHDCEYLDWLFDTFSKYCPFARKLRNEFFKDLCTPEGIKDVLTELKFERIDLLRDNETFHFHHKEEWWDSLWSTGFRGFLELMDSETLSDFRSYALDQVDRFIEELGVRANMSTWTALARKSLK